jgi:DNA-binding NarL/FixJ family response regulator
MGRAAKSSKSKSSVAPGKTNGIARILIVDDHPVLRAGLSRLINSKAGFSVCGEAGDAAGGLELVRSLKPNLVIVDITLPGASGLVLTKNIRTEFPKTPVLVLSMHEEVLYAVRALRAGAAGYIIKQDAIDNIATALRQVLDGERYVSPSIAGQMIAKSGVELASGDGGDPTAVLSDRELEILELIGRGQEVRDIAKELALSPKTVEAHRAHIKSKLNLQNARQVARFAVQWVYGQSN